MSDHKLWELTSVKLRSNDPHLLGVPPDWLLPMQEDVVCIPPGYAVFIFESPFSTLTWYPKMNLFSYKGHMYAPFYDQYHVIGTHTWWAWRHGLGMASGDVMIIKDPPFGWGIEHERRYLSITGRMTVTRHNGVPKRANAYMRCIRQRTKIGAWADTTIHEELAFLRSKVDAFNPAIACLQRWWRRHIWQGSAKRRSIERRTALCMCTHPRLGATSALGTLPSEILQLLVHRSHHALVVRECIFPDISH